MHSSVEFSSLRLTDFGVSVKARYLISDNRADIKSSVQQLHSYLPSF